MRHRYASQLRPGPTKVTVAKAVRLDTRDEDMDGVHVGAKHYGVWRRFPPWMLLLYDDDDVVILHCIRLHGVHLLVS